MSDTASLEALAASARALANRLFSGRPECSNRESCLRAEEVRPLTAQERGWGWARRPFSAYDPARLCRGCAAYWHAEMAAQLLHEAHCWAIRIGAEEARRAQAAAASST